MFSVIIPLYNKEISIRNTITSVLAQTITDFELLVVNDSSTDKSREVVAAMADERIKIIDKANGGVSSARNTGIKAAKYEYVAFLDGDDFWEPDFLESILNLIKEYPEAGAYTTGYVCIYKGKVIHSLAVKKRGVVRNFFATMHYSPVMHSSSVCIKKDTFVKVGMFDERISFGEDYHMWNRLGKHSSIAASPEIKAWYKIDAENRAMNKIPILEKHWTYYIETDEIDNEEMSKYYSRYVRRHVLYYVLKRKFKWAWQLAFKYRDFVSLPSYFLVHQYRELKSIPHLISNFGRRIFSRLGLFLILFFYEDIDRNIWVSSS